MVCLGDSVTLGYPGPPGRGLPARARARIEARGPGVEVFNVALMAWSTPQERIAYERIARKYHPDQVILGICLNQSPGAPEQPLPSAAVGLQGCSVALRSPAGW